jgi:hypothetical protein
MRLEAFFPNADVEQVAMDLAFHIPALFNVVSSN